MVTLLLSFVAIALVFGALSIGVIMGRKPIQGSCGGLSNQQGGSCDVCGGKPEDCQETPGVGRS